jgi:hypothetical protein
LGKSFTPRKGKLQREEAGMVLSDALYDLTQAAGVHRGFELIVCQEQRHGRDCTAVLEQCNVAQGKAFHARLLDGHKIVVVLYLVPKTGIPGKLADAAYRLGDDHLLRCVAFSEQEHIGCRISTHL